MLVVPVPCHFDNYAYIVICEKSGEGGVVDPSEYYPVYKALKKLNIHLTSIFCTHHHNDHIGGLEEFLAAQPELNVYGHVEELSRITGLTKGLSDGDRISVGVTKGEVIHTPGHTRGSVCFLFEDNLFTGDTVFGAGCGRLFEGSPEQMCDSLTKLRGAVSETTKIYFGHEYTQHNLKFAAMIEPENEQIRKRMDSVIIAKGSGEGTTPSTVHLELMTNPFFRCDVPALQKSLQGRGLVDSSNVSEVFAALRNMRNNF